MSEPVLATARPGEPCPCGGAGYRQCCARFLEDGEEPLQPEALMRARYTAYVLGRFDFLRATWHPDTCPADLARAEEPAPRWLGLEIRHTSPPGSVPATVEFVARYRVAGRGHRIHERSVFERVSGRWIYRSGELLT